MTLTTRSVSSTLSGILALLAGASLIASCSRTDVKFFLRETLFDLSRLEAVSRKTGLVKLSEVQKPMYIDGVRAEVDEYCLIANPDAWSLAREWDLALLCVRTEWR